MACGVVGQLLQGASVRLGGRFEIAAVVERYTQVVAGAGEVWIDGQGLAMIRDGFVESPEVFERVAEIRDRLGICGVELQGPLIERDGVSRAPLASEHEA